MKKLWATLRLTKLTRNYLHGFFLAYSYVKIDITLNLKNYTLEKATKKHLNIEQRTQIFKEVRK